MFGNKYKYFRQLDIMDCAPTCLKMVAAFYGKSYSMEFFRENMYMTRNGVNLNGISAAAEKIGLKATPVKLTYKKLVEEVRLPCILHWNQDHFVVLYDVRSRNFFRRETGHIVADPGHGLIRINRETLLSSWSEGGDEKGFAVLIEPTSAFYDQAGQNESTSAGFGFLFKYLLPFKSYILQIVLAMLFGSIVSMLFPFLTQSLVDHGIQERNTKFIHLILFSQLLLFVGNVAVDLIRSRILLHINTRLSISIVSDFLGKLMKLPLNFFESKNIGDITQRISDHRRIEEFLTGSSLSTMFSLVNLAVFSFVLVLYSPKLVAIFFCGSVVSFLWIFFFLKKRKNLDYLKFQQLKENQDTLFELITGMQEIKLNNCEQARRWKWEKIQARLFKINIDSLTLEQYQELGVSFFNQLRNILISYYSAILVLENHISLGAMLSISYIVGQMNGPIGQIIVFVRKIQDAKLSLDRLGEIHNKPNEELNEEFRWRSDGSEKLGDFYLRRNSVVTGIVLKDVSFRYGEPSSPFVLRNLNLHIPKGKVTAIVGSSGSGKTTLLKLLLKFYPLENGEISINGVSIGDISASRWREQCGTVMQDGFIFADTIVRNIAVDGKKIDHERMMRSVEVANIQEYVRRLPLGFSTKIGNGGGGLSGGQRQRLFIARAVYKDPDFLFFDEATSSLDAHNERVIMENLNAFFRGKTVLIVAHRLSTVKNADQIIVLHNGEVAEVGTHMELSKAKGYYYELVKNQLELDAA